MAVRQPLVVDAEQVQHRRVQVVGVDLPLGRQDAVLVRRPVREPALHPAAGEPGREAQVVVLPPRVARLLVERGMTPVTTWSNEREKAVADAIAKAVPSTIVVPKSPLAEIAGIIGRSTLVIGADTGLTHLASAFGLPTVAVFLATEPGLTGPRGPYASTLLAPAGGRVTPAEVVAEVESLMERQALDQTVAGKN